MMDSGGSGFVRVFGVPTILALTCAVGLVAALVGDGLWDGLSWVTLGAPIAIIAWSVSRPAERV